MRYNTKNIKKNIIQTTTLTTPIGEMIAAASQKGICMLSFYEPGNIDSQMTKLKDTFNADVVPANNVYFEQLQKQLDEYFDKKRTEFDIPLQLVGTTYQVAVWRELLRIPYGKTISYKEQATNMGDENGYRAAANANGQNMILILVPCHRVIGIDGKLHGYTAGADKKKFLLELEQNNIEDSNDK